VAAECEEGQEGFAVSTPGSSFRAYFTATCAAAFMAMIFITAQVREGDVIRRPEKLCADSFPRLFVFDTQFFGGFNSPAALKTDVLPVPSQEVEENHLTQTVTGRSVRHT
jgi:hypothetical protein